MSRSQLAEKVGVTEQAIWQYENGYTFPKLEVVNKLKTIFKVKGPYFYQPDLLNKVDMNNIQIQNIAYRSETINSLSKSQSELMHVRFIDAFLKKIEQKINYPKNLLLELRRDVVIFLKNNSEMDRELQIKYIAELARERIGLGEGSNKNLLFLLEKAGAFIFEKEIGDKIDAYSLWTEEDRAYIILGSVKKSAVRRNFDLAHELGHLLLHPYVDFSLLDKNERQQVEREADYFASCFLLPSEIIQKDLEKIKKISNPDSYISLKAKYNVSIQALEMRAYKLGFLTPKQHSYFYRQIAIKNYRLEEPLDREIVFKRPGKIRSIFNLVLTNKLTDLSSIENNFRMNRSLLEKMFSIEPDFFVPFAKEENFTDLNNVLKLNFGSV